MLAKRYMCMCCYQLYVYEYIHTYICIHTYIHIFICLHTHTYVHTYKHAYIHTKIHAYIHTRHCFLQSMIAGGCLDFLIGILRHAKVDLNMTMHIFVHLYVSIHVIVYAEKDALSSVKCARTRVATWNICACVLQRHILNAYTKPSNTHDCSQVRTYA